MIQTKATALGKCQVFIGKSLEDFCQENNLVKDKINRELLYFKKHF